jgi:hypothetical protein
MLTRHCIKHSRPGLCVCICFRSFQCSTWWLSVRPDYSELLAVHVLAWWRRILLKKTTAITETKAGRNLLSERSGELATSVSSWYIGADNDGVVPSSQVVNHSKPSSSRHILLVYFAYISYLASSLYVLALAVGLKSCSSWCSVILTWNSICISGTFEKLDDMSCTFS